MAIVRPFKAIRPARDKANLVASRSYLTYSDETIKEKLDHNPYTFLHVINPDYNSSDKAAGIKKFKLIKKRFKQFISEGILIKDNVESYYIYQKKNQHTTFTGIIGSSAVEDYLNNTIKKHEQTLTKRENMFRDYLDITGFNSDPVLLAHESNKDVKYILEKYLISRAEYEFTTTNKSLHKLWVVNNINDIKTITDAFKKIKKIYIADGHHRCASSALLSKTKNSKLSSYFMSFLIDENQLNILNFNRLVKHLNHLTANELLEKIKVNYTILYKKNNIYSPTLRDEISMYLDGNWYSLISNNNIYSSTTESLDPSILSKNILKPLLNITDERTDRNITFLDGTVPLSTIKAKVDKGEYAAAFILKPIPITAIKKVADRNETMPPKSTYVQPKLRSGLTIYPIQ
jgi:uncharacterized protein (DUF1015 family)